MLFERSSSLDEPTKGKRHGLHQLPPHLTVEVHVHGGREDPARRDQGAASRLLQQANGSPDEAARDVGLLALERLAKLQMESPP